MQKYPSLTISLGDSLMALEKRLTSNIVGKPADKPDSQNIKIAIDIDVAELTATFHCRDSENAGAQKNRFVMFVADADCVLHFTNPHVFGVYHVALAKGVTAGLHVTDQASNDETGYYVSVTMTSMTEGVTAAVAPTSLRDPRIIVP